MYQVEAERSSRLGFIFLVTSSLLLCLCVCVRVGAGTDTPSICNGRPLFMEGQIVLGAFCIGDILFEGAFVLAGFLPGGLWSGGFCPGAFYGVF